MVFFEAEDRSDALEKIPELLKAMWECSGSQLEVWNLYDVSDLVILSIDMDIDSLRDWRLFEVVTPLVPPFIWMLNVMAGRCFLSPPLLAGPFE